MKKDMVPNQTGYVTMTLSQIWKDDVGMNRDILHYIIYIRGIFSSHCMWKWGYHGIGHDLIWRPGWIMDRSQKIP